MPRRPGPDRPTAGPRPRYRPDPHEGRKAPAHGGAGEAGWGRTLSQGWSVLVRGLARRVEDPEAVRYLAQRMYSGPWPGDDRIMWVRIDVDDQRPPYRRPLTRPLRRHRAGGGPGT